MAEYEIYSKAAAKKLKERADIEEKAIKAAEKKALADEKAAKKEEDRIAKEFERKVKEEQHEQELENRENEKAFKMLQDFTRSENLDRFQKELGQMKPGEIRKTGLDLLELQEQLKQEYAKQLEAGDLGGATNTYNELTDTKARLGMIQDLLNQSSVIQGIAQFGGQVLGGEG